MWTLHYFKLDKIIAKYYTELERYILAATWYKKKTFLHKIQYKLGHSNWKTGMYCLIFQLLSLKQKLTFYDDQFFFRAYDMG